MSGGEETTEKKERVAADVDLVAIRGPLSKKANTIVGDASGGEGGCTSGTHGVARDVFIKMLTETA